MMSVIRLIYFFKRQKFEKLYGAVAGDVTPRAIIHYNNTYV